MMIKSCIYFMMTSFCRLFLNYDEISSHGIRELSNIFWNFQDLKKKPKYLVTFTVGVNQKNNINEAVKKVSQYKIYYCLSRFLLLKLLCAKANFAPVVVF